MKSSQPSKLPCCNGTFHTARDRERIVRDAVNLIVCRSCSSQVLLLVLAVS